jgi:hypothetical protein
VGLSRRGLVALHGVSVLHVRDHDTVQRIPVIDAQMPEYAG